ncbi:methyltransferase domain-containing protein [candidate division KSB1 bacterium]|nr:methyltransferase domain-containing protein [candidate division KSB1 bacterium]
MFNQKVAENYDRWFKTPAGRYADKQEKELMLRLMTISPGQSLLDIGCGTGHHLVWFKELDLAVYGIDNSPHMLKIAREKLKSETRLCQGFAENLPFNDKTFQMAAMITTLEFVAKPMKALSEMIRVAREQVLLGVLNRYSLLALKRRLKGKFTDSIYNQARFYSIFELKRMIKKIDRSLKVNWQGTLPPIMTKNPFGAFLGILVRIK